MRNVMACVGILSSVMACGDEVVVMDDGGVGGVGGVGGSGGVGEGAPESSTAAGGQGLAAWCEGVCAARAEDDGLQTCFSAEACYANCLAGGGAWSDPVRDAFRACVEEDPLCFISPEGCMLGVLHDSMVPVDLRGDALGDFEGAAVYAAFTSAATGASVVEGGTFAVLLPPQPVFEPTFQYASVWIDGDGDGQCGTVGDLVLRGDLAFNDDFDVPRLEATFTPVAEPHPGACEFLF